jgi:hypothetical protein
MKFLVTLLALSYASTAFGARRCPLETVNIRTTTISNQCITFTVGQGTGCQWMCDYCAAELNTANYYFTTPVCSYSETGCVGNPVAGTEYTCCSASKEIEIEY